jgi:hypothetical protein
MSRLRIFFISLVTLLAVQVSRAQLDPPYTVGFIPASISEGDIAFPIYEKWHLSGQADFQLVTQGSYATKNPFEYTQRVVVRPWLIYSGFKNIKLWLGYAHNQKYAVEEMGNYETLENRLIVMSTFSQDMPRGNIFEQIRFETKFFDDRNGVHQTIPRIRMRFGVNHFMPQSKSKPVFLAPNIGYYAELMLKFASKDYASENFDIFRLSAYYTAGITPNIHFLAGVIGQMQLRTNGTQFDIYYGPMVSLKYTVKPKERETFDNVDGGAD